MRSKRCSQIEAQTRGQEMGNTDRHSEPNWLDPLLWMRASNESVRTKPPITLTESSIHLVNRSSYARQMDRVLGQRELDQRTIAHRSAHPQDHCRFPHSRGPVMGIFSWIILGLIAGFIGSKLVDQHGQGFWLNIALGIVGALVGGFLFDLFGASGVTV